MQQSLPSPVSLLGPSFRAAAAVHALLEADAQWASLGISLQLAMPPALAQSAAATPPRAPGSQVAAGAAGGASLAAAAPGAASVGPLLLFRAAGDASPCLALSLALRTAKPVLMAGPALLESWGAEGAAEPTASSAGGAAGAALTALVAATQQRLERAQRDALTLPPAAAPANSAARVQEGASRGVLAAGLMAAELSALCQRLVRRRRLAGIAAAARGLGLLSSLPLPLALLQVRPSAVLHGLLGARGTGSQAVGWAP